MSIIEKMFSFINKQNNIAKKILASLILLIPIAIGAIIAVVIMVFRNNENGGGHQDIHIIDNPNGTKIPQNTQHLDQTIDDINKDITS